MKRPSISQLRTKSSSIRSDRPTIFPANDHPVCSICADLSRPPEIARVVVEALSAFGRIDFLVNAAVIRQFSPLLDPVTMGFAAAILELNVLAPLRIAVEIAQRFWQMDPDDNVRHNRSIVNMSSTAGLFIYPDRGQALYGTSKAALNHLTYYMASEFWDLGIRVNAVAPDTFPGRVSTDEVLDAVLGCDRSDKTGEIVRLVGPTP